MTPKPLPVVSCPPAGSHPGRQWAQPGPRPGRSSWPPTRSPDTLVVLCTTKRTFARWQPQRRQSPPIAACSPRTRETHGWSVTRRYRPPSTPLPASGFSPKRGSTHRRHRPYKADVGGFESPPRPPRPRATPPGSQGQSLAPRLISVCRPGRDRGLTAGGIDRITQFDGRGPRGGRRRPACRSPCPTG
jgi:hypothetical protein